MARIVRCAVIAALLFVSSGCRKKVDLVKEWRLEGATKVVLVREVTNHTITLSHPEDVGRFLKFLRKGVEPQLQEELLCLGDSEIQFADRPPCRFGVLLDGQGEPKPKMAVQRFVEGTNESYYYLPKGFVKLWKDRLGLPGFGTGSGI